MTAAISVDELLESYELFLIDAYGVLVTSRGAIDGADGFIRRIEESETSYLILTNDASRLPETCRRHYGGMGLDIPVERILTLGMLLEDYFEEHGLDGADCMVLGPPDSEDYVRRAGGEVVPLEPGGRCDVLVIGDESGYDFLPAVDAALSVMYRQFREGVSMRLVLPNPDLVYPKGGGEFGFASGTIAGMFEDALTIRFPDRDIRFDRLGKPHTFMYERALAHAGVRAEEAVMIGDQLATDIRGANAAGIDSVLAGTGVSDVSALAEDSDEQPTYILETLR